MTGCRPGRRPHRARGCVLVAVLGLALVVLSVPATALAVSPAPAGLPRAASVATLPALPGLPDCKDAPAPEVPGRGVVGFFEGPPATLPPPGNPFVPGSSTSIHEQYGYAGLRWNTYDLGCGPAAARDPEAVIGTALGDWIFGLAKTGVAATGALLTAAYQPDFLKVFDTLITNVVDALHRAVFEQWAALVLAATGFLLVWRARRAKLASSAAAIGWALLVMVIATALFQWPLVAGQAADKTVTTSLSVVTEALGQDGSNTTGSTGATPGGTATVKQTAGEAAAASLHDALLYQTWLGGEFGSANSDVARRYGPAIFDAQALTWREADTLARDPAAGQRIIAAKEAEFKDAAAKVQAEDPDAYEYLVGRRSDARVGYAVLAGVAVLCAVPFLLLSALLVLGALIIVRLAVMIFPAIATLGLFPTMRSLVIGIGNTVAAAVINALVFGLGAAVMVKVFGVVLAPSTGLPGWLVVALVLLLTIVMWFALKPFTRLTQMVGARRNVFAEGAGGVGTLARAVGRLGTRVVTTAVGVAVGDSVAGKSPPQEQPAIAGPRRAEADAAGAPEPVGARRVAGPVGADADATVGDDQPAPVAAGRRGPERGETPRALVPDSDGTTGGEEAGAPRLPEDRPGSRPTRLRPAARAGGDAPSEQDVRAAALPGPPSTAAAAAGLADGDGQGELPTWRPDDLDTDGLPRPIVPDDASGEEVYVIYRPDREPLTRSPGRRRG